MSKRVVLHGITLLLYYSPCSIHLDIISERFRLLLFLSLLLKLKHFRDKSFNFVFEPLEVLQVDVGESSEGVGGIRKEHLGSTERLILGGFVEGFYKVEENVLPPLTHLVTRSGSRDFITHNGYSHSTTHTLHLLHFLAGSLQAAVAKTVAEKSADVATRFLATTSGPACRVWTLFRAVAGKRASVEATRENGTALLTTTNEVRLIVGDMTRNIGDSCVVLHALGTDLFRTFTNTRSRVTTKRALVATGKLLPTEKTTRLELEPTGKGRFADSFTTRAHHSFIRHHITGLTVKVTRMTLELTTVFWVTTRLYSTACSITVTVNLLPTTNLHAHVSQTGEQLVTRLLTDSKVCKYFRELSLCILIGTVVVVVVVFDIVAVPAILIHLLLDFIKDNGTRQAS